MDETNVLDVVRTRLHMFGRWYPDAIDAHYTGFPQQAFAGNCIGELMPPGERTVVCVGVSGWVNGWVASKQDTLACRAAREGPFP